MQKSKLELQKKTVSFKESEKSFSGSGPESNLVSEVKIGKRSSLSGQLSGIIPQQASEGHGGLSTPLLLIFD